MDYEYEQFIRTIQHKAEPSWDEAERTAQVTLSTLAERLWAHNLSAALGLKRGRLRTFQSIVPPHHFADGRCVPPRAAMRSRHGGRVEASDVEHRRHVAQACSDTDLLVVGSRSYGPPHHTLPGSVSAKLMRSCPAPLLVAPRGVEAPERGGQAGAGEPSNTPS